jgi:hypothetical protein
MSENWAVGDLAECLDNTPAPHERLAGRLEVGRIYRVKRCGIPKGEDFFCLAFQDILTKPGRGAAFNANRFRKVLPPKHEDCEPEFVDLLNRIKRKVDA